MILTFNPQSLEVKEKGRVELAKAAKLPLEEAAPYFTAATLKNFQPRYNKFVTAFPDEASRISSFRPDGIGPGEMIAWFVFDDLTLGGKNADIDLLKRGKPFAEVKGGKYGITTNTISNFKLSKDGDPSVSQVLQDLDRFNTTFKRITGQDLTGWRPAEIGKTALDLWRPFNLTTMAKSAVGPRREMIHLPIAPNGDIYGLDNKKLTHIHAEDLSRKIIEIAQSEWKIPVDSKIATLQRIVHRWRAQVFRNYLQDKNIALVNSDTLQMLFFGQLTEDMIELYCIHRNQPWARIYLP